MRNQQDARLGTSIDPIATRAMFDRIAADYDQHAVLSQEIGRRMLERLDYIKLDPNLILDAGCGTGTTLSALLRHYPSARLLALDQSRAMLHRARRRRRWMRRPALIAGDLHRLPINQASVDLVFANLSLAWCHDLEQVFSEVRRILRPHGLFMFSSFGPGTLSQLRQAWQGHAHAMHVADFPDMHDIGDALLAHGFVAPVMDMEMITLTYHDIMDLYRDLRRMGLRNVLTRRARQLTGKHRLAAVRQAYERFRRSDDRRLPASFEIVYGHTWVPDAPAPRVMGPYPKIPIVPMPASIPVRFGLG